MGLRAAMLPSNQCGCGERVLKPSSARGAQRRTAPPPRQPPSPRRNLRLSASVIRACTMTSSAKSANGRRAKHAQQRRGAASPQKSSLEDSLRALNAKLIARLRASEAVAADAVAARTVAQQALQTAQRGRKSIDDSLNDLGAQRDSLEVERDQLRLNCEQLQNTVDQLTKRVHCVTDQLRDATDECDRLSTLQQRVHHRCEQLEKQVLDGKLKLDAERELVTSLERQLQQHTISTTKGGTASMSPHSYSSIDTGDTLRSDTCVSAATVEHTSVQVHDDDDDVVVNGADADVALRDVKNGAEMRGALHVVKSLFDAVWRWGMDLVQKVACLFCAPRAQRSENVPLLRA
eukprot:TRINITY_DN3797_c0_g1_i1.p2 TRINITY_DN3797_c0_g1~~TRINITY_DN3797_c0_g1_i1.p2  ORF type:complete len:348 (-),score=86.01 TRINITY_DN3797_c0_g1_i1:1758-2801(-)